MIDEFWRGKSVLITGHTGFKGGWLTLLLASMGAKVYGYASKPPTTPNLYSVAKVRETLAGEVIADIRDLETLSSALEKSTPEIVFHLAAQPLVRRSYIDPIETFSVNVMGTVNILEAARRISCVKAFVNVTTDKCYENKEWAWGYREYEPMGGSDPYSSSKGCSELITAAYRHSFFNASATPVATARAGNVIGGGDWSEDRLVPDFFRAVAERRQMEVRFPNSTRPWQHVLEPLSGYIQLAEQLVVRGRPLAQAWNFGPEDDDAKTVGWVLDALSNKMCTVGWRVVPGQHYHEAGYLKLDSSKARSELGWRPGWKLDQALSKTVEWQQAWLDNKDMRGMCISQFREHRESTPS